MAGTGEPCGRIFLDAIAADMAIIEAAMDRVAFNSQQYINLCGGNPPPPPVPGMATEEMLHLAKEAGRHDVRQTIWRSMDASIQRTRKAVLHCAAHCRAAIDILMGRI